jgi:hypothetical protein
MEEKQDKNRNCEKKGAGEKWKKRINKTHD